MVTVIGLLAIMFLILILFQISKSTELLNEIKGRDELRDGNNVNGILFLVIGLLGLGIMVYSSWYYKDYYLPEPSSVHGVIIRNMFFWTMVSTVPIFFLTQIALVWYAYRYKNRKGLATYISHDNRLEVIWTVIPAIVMVLLVVEGMRNWYKMTGDAPDHAIVVEATGQQFLWTLRYAGEDNELGTKQVGMISEDNPYGQNWEDKNNFDDFIASEMHIPVNKPVLVKINALDVLHSFYLPHFRVKMDAVPGMPTQFWFEPTITTAQMREQTGNPDFNYELACAELCGKAHYNMRKVVVVETEEEYNDWLQEQKPYYNEMNSAQIEKVNNESSIVQN